MRASLRANLGIALVMTLLILSILVVVIFTAASIVTIGARVRVQDLQAVQALYLAESGVTRACSVLQTSPSWSGQTVTMPTGTVTITVSSVSGATSGTQMWQVDSVGVAGATQHALRAWVQAASFSQYSLFMGISSNIAFGTGQVFQGPVHTNSHFSFYGNPQFTSVVTSSNSDEMVASGNPTLGFPFAPNPSPNNGPIYDTSKIPSNPGPYIYTDNSKFYNVWPGAPGGYANPNATSSPANGPVAYVDPTTGQPSSSFAFSGGQSKVNLPTDTSEVSRAPSLVTIDAGLAGQAGYNPNFTVQLNGGSITVSNPNIGAANGPLSISTGATPPATSVASGSMTIQLGGTPAPVVNIIGQVTGIQGTINGQATVAASLVSNDVNNTGSMYVTGNVGYAYRATPAPSPALPATDELGLVAQQNVYIASSAPNNLEIDGSVMAIGIYDTNGNLISGTGQVTVQNLSSTTPDKGTLTFFGGIINAQSAPKGQLNPDGSFSGYLSNYVYDSRLAVTPPPYYPTTGVVKVVAAFDRGALSGP